MYKYRNGSGYVYTYLHPILAWRQPAVASNISRWNSSDPSPPHTQPFCPWISLCICICICICICMDMDLWTTQVSKCSPTCTPCWSGDASVVSVLHISPTFLLSRISIQIQTFAFGQTLYWISGCGHWGNGGYFLGRSGKVMHAIGESYRTFLKPLIPAIFCCSALEKVDSLHS